MMLLTIQIELESMDEYDNIKRWFPKSVTFALGRDVKYTLEGVRLGEKKVDQGHSEEVESNGGDSRL